MSNSLLPSLITATAIVASIGSIDDYGAMVNMFERSGFTPAKSCSELLANCCDARASHVRFVIQKDDSIRLIDNGLGMSEENARSCLSLFRANHEGEQTMGVSGCGAKPAMYLLGARRHVNILTHKEGEPFLSIQIPFDEMMEQRRYSDMIQMYHMEEPDRLDFCRMISEMDGRPNDNNRTGTIIRFVYSESVASHITQQFTQSYNPYTDDGEYIPPSDRMSIVFGKMRNHSQHPISRVELVDNGAHSVLNLYDYLGGNDEEYVHRNSAHIEIYSRPLEDTHLFRHVMVLNDGTRMEVPRKGAGYSKSITEISAAHYQELQNAPYTREGVFEIIAGTRNGPHFDSQAVLANRAVLNHEYDVEHGISCLNHPTEQDFANYPIIVRNNQVIGKFEYENIRIATSVRGTADTRFDFYHTRLELRYNTSSEQLNRIDTRVIGIQANKNQYSSMMHIYHVPLTRMICWFQRKTSEETKARLRELYPMAQPPVEPDSDEESVSSLESVASSAPSPQPPIQQFIPIPTPNPEPIPSPAPSPEPAPVPVPLPLNHIPVITPQVVSVTQHQRRYISAQEGIDLITHLLHNTEETQIFETIILKYRESYEHAAMKMCFRYMSREQKVQLLIELIRSHHPDLSREMLGGSEIYRVQI